MAAHELAAPLGLTGATAATRYAGATASGAPTTGTFAVGDYIIDQAGKVWVCTGAGTPGTWANTGSAAPDADASTKGIVQLAGDLAGTAASPQIASGVIVNADVNSSAAIAYGKLALTNSVVNGDINSSAAIAYSKLALSNSILNADVSSSAAIVYSKLSLANSIVNADIASAAAIAISKLNITGTPNGSKFLRDDGSWASPSGTGAVVTDTIWDTKGDLAAATGADAASKLAAGTNLSTRLIPDSSTATGLRWAPHVVRKAATETVTASTTLQNDDDLLWAVAANEHYFFQAWLLVGAANVTMDVKFGWSVPSGSTVTWGAEGAAGGGQAGYGAGPTTGTPTLMLSTAGVYTANTNAGTIGLSLAGVVAVGGTAGNVNLQWAQNTSDGGNLQVLVNSILLLTRLA